MAQSTPHANQLRVGLVGLGRAGSAFVPPIVRHPGLTISAAAEVDRETLERFGRDFPVHLYADVEALCKDADVDVVYVATPTHFHTEHVLTALEHHKHVLVAKPMAITLEDGQRMVASAERNGVRLIEAHPQSMEAPVLKMRAVVESGIIGGLRMLHNWSYQGWLYGVRLPEELDTKLGGGVTFRQGAHQFDILRLIGGGSVRSVRAMTGVWDMERPTEGAHAAFLDFSDGTVATAVLNGYGGFKISELTFGLGEGGAPDGPARGGSRRSRPSADLPPAEVAKLKKLRGYGLEDSTPPERDPARGQPFYGLTIVSCERGDMRQSRDGLSIYGRDRQWEERLPSSKSGRDFVLDELYRSVAHDVTPVHDGPWSLATLELTLAVLRSSRERSEIMLEHQVPLRISAEEVLGW